MKNLIFVALFLIALIVCAKSYSIFTQNQTVEATAYNSLSEIKKLKQSDEFSFEKLISSQQNTSKKLNWITPEYAGLKLGKATQNDVFKVFGEPKSQFHPFNEYESTDDLWTYYYENINGFDGRISFTFDIRSKILKEVWLRPNDERLPTIEQAIDFYGKDYYLREVEKSLCSSKELTKIEYPFTIVYPQKGIFLWVREGNQVEDIFYMATCP